MTARHPQVIAHYSVVRALEAGGGLGQGAYLALRTEPAGSDRLYLVKVVGPRAVPKVEVERHLDAAARLTHPAHFGALERLEHDGGIAVVFEHHDGLRLEQVQEHLERESERLADKAIWHLAHQLTGALAEAHELRTPTGRLMKMVHGHLGPDMIQVGWNGRVRLIGTGLTPLFGDAERAERALAYRAPEVRNGARPTAAADVFSVCALVWSLLTGRRPSQETAHAPKLATLRSDVPAALADAIDRGMSADSEARQVTCRHLESLIEDAFDGVGEADELRWNMQVFRALSLFSWSLPPAAPPTATRIEIGNLPRPISLLPRPMGVREAPPSSAEPVTEPHPTKPRASEAVPHTLRDGGNADEQPTLQRTVDPPAASGAEKASSAGAARPSSTLVIGDEPVAEIQAPPLPQILAQPNTAIATPAFATQSGVAVGTRAAPLHDVAVLAAPPLHDVAVLAAPPVQPAESAPARRGVSAPLVVVLLLVLGGAAFGLGWAMLPRGTPPSGTDTNVDARPDGSSPSTPQAATSPASSATAVGTAPTSRASSEPEAALSAEPGASASASASADAGLGPAADDAGDESKLLSFQGYLLVSSRADADVYVQGIHVGPTNKKNATRCWTRFVRLREKNDGAWLTAGQAVKVTCMATTTVQIDP